MGMYDYVRCMVPLPVDGDHSQRQFQSKSLNCDLDSIEIREDGSLWIERYDTEDHSDPNAEGLMSLVGKMTRVNQEMVPLDFTGEIRFYDFIATEGPTYESRGWFEFSAYFVKGCIKHLELITYKEPSVTSA